MAGNTGFDEENNMENHADNPGNARGAGNSTPSHVSEIEDKAGVVHPVHAKQLEEERTVTFTGDATGTASWKFGAPANPGEASETVELTVRNVSSSQSGLMSAEDKAKLDGIESGAEVNQNAYGSVKVGNSVVSAAGKTDTLELVQGSGVTFEADTANRKVTISASASPGDSSPTAVSSSASAGVSGDFSRADHVHNIVVAEGSAPGTVKVAGQDAAVNGWDTKADIAAGATENDFVAFDNQGNIKDSGHKHSDYKTVQQAVSDPPSSGTNAGLEFISEITQDANGIISPVKKGMPGATSSQSGVVKLADSIGATVSIENNKAATEKAVRDAINALDVASVGGEGKYIGEISEADGKISATSETADTTPTSNSKKLITSGGVKAAIDALDVTDTAVAHKFVTAVSETDGKVGVTRAQPAVSDVDGLQNALNAKQDSLVFDGTYDSTDNKAATVSSVVSRINDLDSDATSADGTHVQVKVTQTDGKITAVSITSDTTETTSNKASSINSSNPSVVEYPTSAAVADFVNSSISTNTATFRGTLSLADIGLTYPATEQQIVAALNVHTWPSGVTITNNDYVNVTVNNPATADVDTYKRFKYSAGSPGTWEWEFDINNTTFTQAQMDAINSGATTTKIAGYDAHVSDRANPHEVTKTQVGLGNVANTGDSDIPVSGGTTKFTTGGAYTELNKKADKASTVTGVAWDSTNSKITQTVNGTTGDVVSAATLKSAMALDNVDNTSDATKKSSFTGSIADGDTGFVTGDDAYDALAGKQDSLATQTAYTSAGGATKVPQITTNTLGQVTGIAEVTITGVTPAAHAHGNIADGGTLQTTDVAVASGDKLVVTDSSNGDKVARASVTFDTSKPNMALTQAGTWAEFNNNPAFSKVKVGNVTVEADAADDTIEIVAGSGITLTPDATNDTVTVAHTNSVTAGTIGSAAATSGLTVDIPYANFDSAGHITGNGVHVHTVPDATTLAKGAVQLQDSVGSAETEDGKAVTPKAVRDAINDLDVASAGGDGKYIKSISEVDGKVVPVEETMDSVPTAYSVNAATSGGIKDELDRKVDVDELEDISLSATYDSNAHRLTFNDIIFDNIYPVVGKYGMAVFAETSSSAAVDFSGDKDWLLDWRPYLIDMTAKEGEIAKTPVAELQRNNWLRKVDGSFAPVCGIKASQKTALDGKSATLMFGNAASHSAATVASMVTNAFADGIFQAENMWNYLNTAEGLGEVNQAAGTAYACAIEVEMYDGTTVYSYGNYQNNHIPAPWETTETKYSVFIGRDTDVYLVDGSEKYGEYMRGLAAKPVPVGSSQFDPEFFKLKRTGISPGPSTVVGEKIRNFFFNYVNPITPDAYVAGGNGPLGILYNNGTYPAVNGPNQYKAVQWSRGCNYGGANGVAYPVAEGGFHAYNAFICSLEAAYRTRNLWDSSKFSTGNSANDACNSESTYKTNGGLILNGDGNTKYYFTFNQNMKNTYGITSDAIVDAVINYQFSHFQCMEPQVAASLAAEMSISPGTGFKWNSGVWHYDVPSISNINSIADGHMNCRIYKEIAYANRTIGGKAGCSGSVNLRCALAEGVNPTGDIMCFMGGGCELVYETTGTGVADYMYSFYLEPDQTKWITGSYVTTPHVTDTDYGNEKHTNNAKFQAETQYTAIITDSTAGGTSNDYSLSRTGYTPLRKIAGGAFYTGECAYNYRQIGDSGMGSVGIRTRRRVVLRGYASRGACSPRYLYANSRPSGADVPIGCTVQVLLA